MSQPLVFNEHDEQLTLERVLRQVLPGQVTPFVNPRNHTLAVFGGTDSPHNAIEVFTSNEWAILLALVEFYPYYSPYEVLLARLTSTSPEYCRTLIQEAHQHGTLRQELGPIRDVIKKLRIKLRSFSLAVVSLHGLGYLLTLLSASPLRTSETSFNTGRTKTLG